MTGKTIGEQGWAELYAQLNPRQQAAVDALEGPVMVLAGPGTGKTQVLTARIANILRQTQMDSWNILCLTFTDSAAGAMRERLLHIIGEAAFRVRIGTFHSFCNEIIADNPAAFPAAAQWTVLADVERVELFRSLLDELPGDSPLKPFGHPYVYVGDLLRLTQSLKKEGVSPQRLQALIRASEAAGGRLEEALYDFFALPAAARTDDDCQAAAQTMHTVCREAGAAEEVWPQFAAAFERYTAAQAEADGKRAAGKARTVFKNEVKRMVERMVSLAPRQHELTVLYRRYQERLAAAGKYDYEDMIMFVLERLRTDEALLARYQEQFQYVLVDEYQDTNGAQNELLWLLGSFYPNPNIFVVGDDNQSVFRFQGASLENLLSFYERYREHVQVLTLTENYRSHQIILDAAGAVIAHNAATLDNILPGIDRKLISHGGRPARIERRKFATEDAENYFVASRIAALLEDGIAPQEIAVLYRNNRDAESLADVLLRRQIPVRLATGEDVLQGVRVRQLVQLLTVVADMQREDRLAEILQYDFLGLDALDVLRAIHAAGRTRQPLFLMLADAAGLAAVGVQEPALLLRVARQLAAWHRAAENETLQQLFDRILHESGLLGRIMDQKDQLTVLHHLTTLFNELRRLNAANHGLTVREFTDRLQLLAEHGVSLSAEPWQTRSAAVQLLTAHKAKGLEFAHVFLIRLADKHWGNVRERGRLSLPPGVVHHDPIAGQANNEDERRLFYVALTRAKERLYLSYAQDGGGRERTASLFWHELPAETVEDSETEETEDEALARLHVLRLHSPQPVPGHIRDWLAERLVSYTLSVTHLNNYLDCPRLFLYRNLVLAPAAKTRQLAFGTAVHAALRDLMAAAAETGEVPPEDFLLQRFERFMRRETLADSDLADSLQVGRQALRQYYRQYHRQWPRRVLVEYDFGSHGVHAGAARLTGKLDKIEVLDPAAKTVNVVDYKTGNPDTASRHVRHGERYWRQLVFYQLLSVESKRFPYTMVSAELDFIQPSAKTGAYVKRRFRVTENDVDDLRQVIAGAWEDITSLAFLEKEGCGECVYCAAVHLSLVSNERAEQQEHSSEGES
ncbi:MAG: hypothetical protein COT71_00345 [Candidatus Andersenbacteria bacterium CG10_big_fil_rev_8_21_14_0_10_54_11]|uniref:DNA 3'-5' helicase n=1 Tax=Candidatus Andersenbacteria bacterium CG10_big_fil_rev_8_21_14_0_10_54_11 TaxID=1974485 RepID=A0A2M6X0F6_9BACT|nr:MAG: hypothetical protein COT71_00345 [Candidatus Andersenbacteria bacterium CG10_big_fil_rev_8_21_14_0_10_54_11]